MTVNRGQGAEERARDQAVETSLSVDGPSNSTMWEAQLTQIRGALGNWVATLIDYYVFRWERPGITS